MQSGIVHIGQRLKGRVLLSVQWLFAFNGDCTSLARDNIFRKCPNFDHFYILVTWTTNSKGKDVTSASGRQCTRILDTLYFWQFIETHTFIFAYHLCSFYQHYHSGQLLDQALTSLRLYKGTCTLWSVWEIAYLNLYKHIILTLG